MSHFKQFGHSLFDQSLSFHKRLVLVGAKTSLDALTVLDPHFVVDVPVAGGSKRGAVKTGDFLNVRDPWFPGGGAGRCH